MFFNFNQGLTQCPRTPTRELSGCLAFIVFCVGMGVVAIVAISNGNPDRLTMGTDSYGLVCGSVNQKVFGDATYEIDLSNRVGFERTKGWGV